MSPLQAVRVEIDFFTPTVPRMTIYFPAYVVASDYKLNLCPIDLASSPTPANGNLSTVLVGDRIYAERGNLLPVPSNAIAILLPPTLLEPFANAIKAGTIYFRPSERFLTNRDGSTVTMSLNPLPIDIIYDGLSSSSASALVLSILMLQLICRQCNWTHSTTVCCLALMRQCTSRPSIPLA